MREFPVGDVLRNRNFKVAEGYNPTIDYVRIVAAFFIVFFHAKTPGWQLGEVAVGFFVISMVLFTGRGAESGRKPLGAALAARGEKLLGPWVVWSAVSIAMVVLSDIAAGAPVSAGLMRWLPPQGSMAQLWFLPWAFVITVAIFLLSRVQPLTLTQPLTRGAALLLTIVMSVLCCAIVTYIDLPIMLWLSVFYLPSVCAGLLFYGLRNDGVMLLGAALIVTALGFALYQFGLNGYLQLLYGVPIGVAAMLVRLPELPFARKLGGLAMDVYLVHIICMAIVSRVLGLETLFDGCVVCLFAVVVSLLLQKLRPYLNYPVLKYI